MGGLTRTFGILGAPPFRLGVLVLPGVLIHFRNSIGNSSRCASTAASTADTGEANAAAIPSPV